MAKKDYSKLSKEELIALVEKLESRKKYGLVWDEERTKEKFEKESENALPVLKEVKSKEIKTDPTKPTNILIEGDNYHALSVLNYTHQGKIDVIYIDPPYNTGNRDFKYNDNYVDKEDAYRHSKWLSFMSKRLRLAKNLLKDDGVIFISIDDNEQAQLKLLCDEIFGGENFISNLVWHNKYTVSNDTKYISGQHEYIIFYCKLKQSFTVGKIERTAEYNKSYRNPDNDPRGPWKPTPLHAKSGTEKSKYIVEFSNGITWECPSGRYPRYSKEKLLEFYREGSLHFNKNGGVDKKTYLTEVEKNGIVIGSILKFDVVGHTHGNNEELANIIGKGVFDNPKGTKLIEFLVKIANKEKDATILDFFAGSGTTGHAVLDLNKQDGGNRQFILCTNNENNIATEVCYPRIQKVIKGYTNPKGQKIEGLGGNLKYFKTAFVKNSISRDDLKIRITQECTEMLCLREGIFDEVKTTDNYRIFAQNGRVMGVYYSLEREALSSLKKELDKIEGEKILYCFTLDPLGLDKNDFADWQDVSFEAIPEPILDIYKDIYQL